MQHGFDLGSSSSLSRLCSYWTFSWQHTSQLMCLTAWLGWFFLLGGGQPVSWSLTCSRDGRFDGFSLLQGFRKTAARTLQEDGGQQGWKASSTDEQVGLMLPAPSCVVLGPAGSGRRTGRHKAALADRISVPHYSVANSAALALTGAHGMGLNEQTKNAERHASMRHSIRG